MSAGNWLRLYLLQPGMSVVFLFLTALLFFFSYAGENMPLQLWYAALSFPSYHFLLSWAIEASGWLAVLTWLAGLVLLAGIIMILDWRVQGRSIVPFAVFIPVLILGFCFRSTLASSLTPPYYLVLLALQALIMVNAAICLLKSITGKKH